MGRHGSGSISLIPAGWVGVALTYSIDMTMFLKASVMMVAQVEGAFSAVERLRRYAHELPAEAPVLTRDVVAKGGAAAPPLDAAWPAAGAVTFRDVRMRYRDGPLVLKGLSLAIAPREKVGVAGRTGMPSVSVAHPTSQSQ